MKGKKERYGTYRKSMETWKGSTSTERASARQRNTFRQKRTILIAEICNEFNKNISSSTSHYKLRLYVCLYENLRKLEASCYFIVITFTALTYVLTDKFGLVWYGFQYNNSIISPSIIEEICI